MILGLQKHKYEPELNELVFINSARIRVPNIETTKDARKKLLSPVKCSISRYAKIEVKYPSDFSYCNKTYKGTLSNTKELHRFLKILKSKHEIDTSKLLYNESGLTGIIKPSINITFKRDKV